MPISPHTPRPFDLHIKLQWRRPGAVTLEGSSLTFPNIPSEPGVYRIRCQLVDGTTRVYIGESGNLRARARSYARGISAARAADHATTGKLLPANRQLHDDLVLLLKRGGAAQYQYAKDPEMVIGNKAHHLDMRRQFQRRLIENAALVYSELRGRAEIINAGGTLLSTA